MPSPMHTPRKVDRNLGFISITLLVLYNMEKNCFPALGAWFPHWLNWRYWHRPSLPNPLPGSSKSGASLQGLQKKTGGWLRTAVVCSTTALLLPVKLPKRDWERESTQGCFQINGESPVPLQWKPVLKFSLTSTAEQQSSATSKVSFMVLILLISTIRSFQQGSPPLICQQRFALQGRRPCL